MRGYCKHCGCAPVVAQSDEFEVVSIRQACVISAVEYPAPAGWPVFRPKSLGQTSDSSGFQYRGNGIPAKRRTRLDRFRNVRPERKVGYRRRNRQGSFAGVAANGPKLRKAAEPEGRQIENWGKDDLNALNVPVTEFARVLQSQVGRTVTDQSGIEGAFDSVFTALQEQYGLRLESRKGPVEMTVIDHIERPSEN
jgi:hypothetical protein